MRRFYLVAGASLLALALVFVGYGVLVNRDTDLDALPPPSPTLTFEAAYEAELMRLQRAGHVLQALFVIESHAQAVGWSADAYRKASELADAAGDAELALSYLVAASAFEPDHAALMRVLATKYLEFGRWQEAQAVLRRLVTTAPADHWAHFQLALIDAPFHAERATTHLEIARAERGYQLVSDALLDVLRQGADNATTAFRVGLVFVKHELWAYAELAFAQAAALNAPDAEALAYLALVRDQQGKDGGAQMEQAVMLAPDNVMVRYLLGVHFRMIGDDAASLGAFIEALALDPENPALYAELGMAYRRVGYLEQADYWLRQSVEVSNRDPRFQELLALFYVEETPNLTVEGVSAMMDAATQLPDNPDVRAGFGWALYTLGRVDDGIAEIEAALKDDPANVRALYYRARVHADRGETAQAAALLRRVVDVPSPVQLEAQRLLNELM